MNIHQLTTEEKRQMMDAPAYTVDKDGFVTLHTPRDLDVMLVGAMLSIVTRDKESTGETSV